MTQQLRVTQKADFTGAEVIGVADYTMPWGRKQHPNRYFVDPANGSDAYDGRSWDTAFASFEAGIDACRFYYATGALNYTDKSIRSFLFLAPGHYNETTQLLWSGYNISVVGCTNVPGKDYGVSFNYDGSSSATAVMLINGSGNGVYNCHFYNDAAIPTIYLYFPGDNNIIKDCVIECDGTNATYGIYATTMKGSRIENVTVCGAATTGIAAYYDAANQYAIDGWIKDCHISSNYSNTKGIFVHTNLTCHNFWVEHNFVGLTNGSSCKGIDVDATSGVYVVDNYVSVPTSATPIEHAGGEQFWLGNHTAAGTTNADPAPAAGA